jgi:hypothetical protein
MGWEEAGRVPAGEPSQFLAEWFASYVMRPHPELGRTGHVCPYMAQATRLNLVRIAVSPLTPEDGAQIAALLRSAQAVFDAIPCEDGKRVFRSAIIAFPACTGPEGIAALERAQHSLRYRAALRRHMIGLFEPDSAQPGIANRAFPSFRAPLPVIAIRTLVERDGPFMLRNPPMALSYLAAFRRSGLRNLLEAFRGRRADRKLRGPSVPGGAGA